MSDFILGPPSAFMKKLAILFLLFVPATHAQTTIVVPAGGNIQAAINASQCGDVIKITAGASWDNSSPYNVPNKGCGASNPIRIATTATLPLAEVSPSSAASMPRLRATGGGGVFQTAANAGYWIFDGLEVTDNVSGNEVVNFLFDFSSNSGANNITILRSYIHPKEIGTTDYTRNTVRAIGFEGSGLLFKWNYAAGFLGRQPDNQLPTTQVILCVACNNVTLTENFMQAWYATIFTGGGGSNPQHTATISNPSTTSATFSSVAGLSPGILLRLNLTGTATSNGTLTPYDDVVGRFNSTVITRTGGEPLIDFNAAGSQQGYHIRFTPTVGSTTYRGRLKAVSGNAMTVVWEYGEPAPAGTYNWTLWAVAKVSSVAGNVVNYAGHGQNRLLQAPTNTGQAAWRSSAVVYNWTVTKNTIDTPYDYSVHEHAASGNSPKGGLGELKDMDGMLVEGNEFTGYPSTIGLSNRSNEGGTPWSTMRNLTFRSNFVNYRLTAPNAIRQFMIAQTDDYSNTATPGENIVITNNLVKAVNVIAQSDAMVNATITHNTFINDNQNAFGSSAMFGISASANTTFSDNIVAHNEYGLNCQAPPNTRDTCWPGLKASNNVVVLTNAGISLNSGSWGVGSIITPIPTSFAQVGFINSVGNDYRLSASSPFKGKGTSGSDPGVDWAPLVSALGYDPAGGPVPSPTATPSPSATPSPTPSPSPAPVPTPTPTPAEMQALHGYVYANDLRIEGALVEIKSNGVTLASKLSRSDGYFWWDGLTFPVQSQIIISKAGFVFPVTSVVQGNVYYVIHGATGPTPTPTASPIPSPKPSPIPTPVPACSITAPPSVTMPSGGNATVSVNLTDMTVPVSVTAVGSTGQIAVYPGIKTVTGTSALISFSVGVRKRAGTVTFNSVCGQRVMQVLPR